MLQSAKYLVSQVYNFLVHSWIGFWKIRSLWIWVTLPQLTMLFEISIFYPIQTHHFPENIVLHAKYAKRFRARCGRVSSMKIVYYAPTMPIVFRGLYSVFFLRLLLGNFRSTTSSSTTQTRLCAVQTGTRCQSKVPYFPTWYWIL